MTARTVLCDANVPYSAPLRDLYVWLAIVEACRVCWSDAIHAEWVCNVLADRPDLKTLASVGLLRTAALLCPRVDTL